MLCDKEMDKNSLIAKTINLISCTVILQRLFTDVWFVVPIPKIVCLYLQNTFVMHMNSFFTIINTASYFIFFLTQYLSFSRINVKFTIHIILIFHTNI